MAPKQWINFCLTAYFLNQNRGRQTQLTKASGSVRGRLSVCSDKDTGNDHSDVYKHPDVRRIIVHTALLLLLFSFSPAKTTPDFGILTDRDRNNYDEAHYDTTHVGIHIHDN